MKRKIQLQSRHSKPVASRKKREAARRADKNDNAVARREKTRLAMRVVPSPVEYRCFLACIFVYLRAWYSLRKRTVE